jgi:hypothetical protein
MTAPADGAARCAGADAARAAVLRKFADKLDKYLPEQGPLKPWTISEIETALTVDMREVACAVIEARIGIDGNRVPPEKPKCPGCGAALSSRVTPVHRHLMLGRIRYEREAGHCPACGGAFSPSGLGVVLRRGLR